MEKLVGKYQHLRNENLDEYFKAVGVPFIPRKMMTTSKPSLEISHTDGEWTITTTSYIRTTVLKFKLGEEYSEYMPGGFEIKNTTTFEDNKLITVSVAADGSKTFRTYELVGEECIITLKHEKSGTEAKRHFKKVA